jgi:hypothetical protein
LRSRIRWRLCGSDFVFQDQHVVDFLGVGL